MTDEQLVITFLLATAAFAIGYHTGQQKQQQQAAQTQYPGTGADAMAWFTDWGKQL